MTKRRSHADAEWRKINIFTIWQTELDSVTAGQQRVTNQQKKFAENGPVSDKYFSLREITIAAWCENFYAADLQLTPARGARIFDPCSSAVSAVPTYRAQAIG